MEPTVRRSTKQAMHRKVIDIKPDTFRGLSVIAASRGINLKKFIESSLDEIVESYDDAAVYRYLQQTDPEGMEMLSDEEQTAFEKRCQGAFQRQLTGYRANNSTVCLMSSRKLKQHKALKISLTAAVL